MSKSLASSSVAVYLNVFESIKRWTVDIMAILDNAHPIMGVAASKLVGMVDKKGAWPQKFRAQSSTPLYSTPLSYTTAGNVAFFIRSAIIANIVLYSPGIAHFKDEV
jgi:hypothetical protein